MEAPQWLGSWVQMWTRPSTPPCLPGLDQPSTCTKWKQNQRGGEGGKVSRTPVQSPVPREHEQRGSSSFPPLPGPGASQTQGSPARLCHAESPACFHPERRENGTRLADRLSLGLSVATAPKVFLSCSCSSQKYLACYCWLSTQEVLTMTCILTQKWSIVFPKVTSPIKLIKFESTA